MIQFLRDNAPFLAAGLLLTFLSGFGQTYFISLFAGIIRTDFNLSHGAWGTIYAVGTMASAVAMIWSGVLTDVFRVRTLAVVILGGLSLACIAMALLPSVWLLPVVIFALRFFGQGMSVHVASVAMARWYVATRGRALAIAGLGYSIGEASLPIIFVALMSTAPTRMLWLISAAITLAVLPIILRLLRGERTPQSVAEESAATGMENRHWTRRDVLRHWLFWAIIPVILGPPAWGTALFFHQVHIAEVKEWEHLQFVALFPLYTVSSVSVMLASGWAVDRFGTRWLLPLSQLPVAVGFALLSSTSSLLGAGLAMMMIGATSGMNATVPMAFWAEHYGTRHLGAIKALAAAFMVLGSAIGPGLTGGLIDFGITFPGQMLGIGVWFVAVFTLTWVVLGRAQRLLPAS